MMLACTGSFRSRLRRTAAGENIFAHRPLPLDQTG
jgi:hypothetical protein